ncbi:MAG: hypothetical protein HY350_02745 [Candidatus Omnitrophica bacterium]|nr:hypothetical protein [Candidatus Omnitrophota bacterium]
MLEYTLILGVVAVALVGMQVYFKRGIQSMVKVVADDYGSQGDPISNTEIEIKRQIYSSQKPLMSSNSDGTWNQKIENLGDSNIRTELSGNNTLNAVSLWVGGDYRTRRLQQANAGPEKK